MAERGLDDAAFARLEAAGGVTLTHDMKERICAAVKRCAMLYEYSLAYSREVRQDTALLAKHGPEVLAALDRLQRTPAGFLPLVYEEGTDMAVFFHGEAISSRHRELQARMPDFLAMGGTLIDGAVRRTQELASRKPKRRPADTHIGTFCREMAQIFKEAGGSATIGGSRNGPFSRFLAELYLYLPSDIRPISADAMVKQARSALDLLKKPWNRRQPQLCIASTGLDEAIAAALKKCSIADPLGRQER